MLRRLTSFLLRLYFVRVPVLAWLILLLLGPCGYAFAGDFFSGLLYVTEAKKLVLVSAAAFVAAAAYLGSFNLIRAGARQRFSFNFPMGGGIAYVLVAHTAPLSLVSTIMVVSLRQGAEVSWLRYVLAVMGGYLITAGLVFVSRLLQLLFTSAGGTDPMSLFLPGAGLSPWGAFWKRAELPPVKAVKTAVMAVFSLIDTVTNPLFRTGYRNDSKQPFGIEAGHIYAATLAIISFLFYWTLGVCRQVQIDSTSMTGPARWLARVLARGLGFSPWGVLDPQNTPALGWVLFFFTMAVWILAGLTYCLDRWRIPLVGLLVVLIFITGGSPETDNFYRVGKPLAVWSRPGPAQLLRDRAAKGRRLILLSAPGGGIQSAAWTTWVIKELERASGNQFLSNVAVMSGVSGGSVGLFHLAAAGFDPERAFENAKQSAIDDVAWGYMVPDIGRIFNPWVRNRLADRGWALENALEANARVKNGLFLNSPGIVPSDSRPALILNATIMETGEPLVFSTSDFVPRAEQPKTPCGPRRTSGDLQDFNHLYEREIRLVTAARLSASFPYVSPGSRTFEKEPLCADYHILDGGYYDNYGIFSLTRWLLRALSDPSAPRLDKILLVRLYAFPEEPALPSIAGWRGQFSVPVSGVLNAREGSQNIVARSFVELLKSALPDGVSLTQAEFRYQKESAECGTPPLNWTLTKRQMSCIENMQWTDRPLQDNRKTVLDFLGVNEQGGRQ